MANGLGPYWFPAWLRLRLTRLGSSFFDEAAWDKHDEGYIHAEPSRVMCDLKFLQAMLRDASKADTTTTTLKCCALAGFLWVCVRLGGWASYDKTEREPK